MTISQEGFQRIVIAVSESMHRAIESACANADKGDWLRLALQRALDSEWTSEGASMVDRVDTAAKADGLDRTEWLRRAALEKLARTKLQRKGPHQ
ncbi:hypothetical protein NKI25_08020 [Mesorhizobium sp. M0808]|uniref:hypothetical protein n=1 Tax=Mesorhizobium sp. M0808 TaxID=2957002 RepID=UPI0033365569